MFTVLLCIFISKLQTAVTQFPDHIDLQKVGEAIFNNEKYNVLKPTTHIMSDYFKDTMLRQGNTDFPTKRVFIDKNGFRHFWTGFLTPSESLRKTDGLKDYTGVKKPILRDGGDEETKTEDDATTVTVEETTTEKAEDDSEKKDPDPEIIEEALTAADEITTAIADIVTTPTADLTTTGYPVFRAEEIATAAPLPENTVAPYDPGTTVYPHDSLSVTKRIRTVAKTTFFCPYLGTISMSAFLD